MKTWHLFLYSAGCALSIRAADSNGFLPEQFRVVDRGHVLVRWSDVESNSVRVSVWRYMKNGVQQETNPAVDFRFADMPEPAVRKIYDLYEGERIQIKGRDGLTSVAGRLRAIFPSATTGEKQKQCTLVLVFETREEAEIAADYLAGRTRRPQNPDLRPGAASGKANAP